KQEGSRLGALSLWEQEAGGSNPPVPTDFRLEPRLPSPYACQMRICPACGTENPEQARFCLGCGSPLADAAPAAAPSEERKVITAIFVDLVGSTARSEQLDPEDVKALVAPYHARVRAELERHRSEEHTSELQSRSDIVCRLLLEKKNK